MPNNIENRQMPIFVSSTFLDMQEERDELIKRTFPRLEELALQRKVLLSHVDLRWGVTAREAESGFALEVCLNEIERCLPFFVGLIGDRYGWCPTFSELSKNSYLLERYEWIEKDIEEGLSATEIEMQFAALRKLHPVHGFFFIKKNRQKEKDEIAEEKVQRLIGSITSNGQQFSLSSKSLDLSDDQLCYSYYSSVEELGQLVELSMMKLLDLLFPVNDKEDVWSRERQAQEAYLRELCDIYVPQVNNKTIEYSLDRMDDRYCMISSGLFSLYGKSAFVANWLNEHKNDNSHNYIYHFIDAGYLGGNCSKILERLCFEVANLYGLSYTVDNGIGNKPDFTALLSRLLEQISRQKPLYIILDGLQHFSGDKMLEWMPRVPENVCLIITAPYGDDVEKVFERRFGTSSSLFEFREEEVRMFISEFLGKYGKGMSPFQVETILEAIKGSHYGFKDILTLKLLLKELVLFGSHEQLDQRISFYTEDNLEHFYSRMFERIENDCGEESVRLVIGLIAYSRAGLSDAEIVDISGINMLQWSLIRLSLSHLLSLKDGKYYVSKLEIARQIDQRYYSECYKMRKRLVSYFSEKDDFRSIDECLFQNYHLENFDMLYRLILDLDVFIHLYENDLGELLSYWKELYKIGGQRHFVIGNYADLDMSYTAENAYILSEIGVYARTLLGDQQSAMKLFERSKNIYEFIPHYDYETLANVYFELDMLDEADACLDKILGLAEFMHDSSDTSYPLLLSLKGSILLRKERWEEGVEVLNKALQMIILSKGEYCTPVIEIYRKLISCYHTLKEDATAIDYIEKDLAVIRKVWGEQHLFMADEFSLYAVVHRALGHYVEAINYYRKALDIFKKWLPENHKKVISARELIISLQSKFKKNVKNRFLDSLFGRTDRNSKKYPLTDEEFKETMDYFEGIVDDLYINDEGWENGKKEYQYTFKYKHDCIVGNHAYSYGPSENIYIYIDSFGMYESCGRSFETLRDAQIHSLLRYYYFYEQYCDYLESKYIP